ncbi:MAG: PKD domain-containing protein [Marmoricola sp.]
MRTTTRSHPGLRRWVASGTVVAAMVTMLVLAGSAGYASTGSVFTWHMDETSGTTMVDSTGGQDGVLNDVALGEPGVSGTAYGFNGTSSRVIVPDNPVLNPGDADVHISFYLKTTTTPAVPDYDLFRKGEAPGQEYKVEMQPNGQASCDFRGSLRSKTVQDGPDLSDGAWHHIECDKDASSVTLTVDGTSYSAAKAVGSVSNNYDVVVGAYPRSDYYQGGLDDITLEFGPSSMSAPAASFAASPTSGNAPLAVHFTDTSTGPPTQWSWTFGDGSTSNQENPSHTYTAAGTYKVTLQASNGVGSSSASASATVANAPAPKPTAQFTMSPSSGSAPLTVKFTDTSLGAPTGWSWDFGDGTTSSVRSPSHTYKNPGSYTVTLTATNAQGSDAAQGTVGARATSKPPQGSYTVSPDHSWAGWTKVELVQQALSDNGTPPAKIGRVVDWGDGTQAFDWTSGTRLGHVYDSAGSYRPTVTLTGQAGNKTTVTLPAVTVGVDDIAPTVWLHRPHAVHRVSSWRRLRGTTYDHQSGVSRVVVKAMEKRGRHWYAYHPTRHAWVRTANWRGAWRRAGWAQVRPHGQQWSTWLSGLHRGRLVLYVTAHDRADNTAKRQHYHYTLTRN